MNVFLKNFKIPKIFIFNFHFEILCLSKCISIITEIKSKILAFNKRSTKASRV